MYSSFMRLTRWARGWLALAGIVLVAAGGVGAVSNWSGVALTALIVAGVFLLLSAVVGVFPRGSIKERSIEWPEVDEHPRVEAIEAEVAALRGELAKARGELAKARDEATSVTDLLIDYILAHEPAPDDDMSDDERVRKLDEAIAELSNEIDVRYFTGEIYNDRIDVRQLERWRDRNEKALKREERRQAARGRFGLSVTNHAQRSSID
jgi:hypothetical protein